MDTLNLVPHSIIHAGESLPVVSVQVNDHSLAVCAAPISASDHVVYLEVCPECYSSMGILLCGDPHIAVRRHNNVIFWYASRTDWSSIDLPFGKLWLFDRDYYEDVLGGSSSDVPDFIPDEINQLLPRSTIPHQMSGLYTLPELVDDPQGWRFLALLDEVAWSGGFEIAEAPPRSNSISVGIDAPGFPECILEIGMVQDQCVVRFAANPAFPVWLTSAATQRCLSRYVADPIGN